MYPAKVALKGSLLFKHFSTATNKPKTAIVMLNMGGPRTIDQVSDYLHRIMTDKDIIQFPFFGDQLGPMIAKMRTKEVQHKYSEIGGGSPIYKWTQLQGELLCKNLDKVSPATAPHKHYTAFRYVPPFTEDAMKEVEKDGAERVILFSQYPQYSCATSGSSFNAIYNYYKEREFPKHIKLSIIDRWATHPLLIKTFSDRIREALKNLDPTKRKDAIILFSAHSLPLKAVNRGDPYPSEVGTTVNLVMEDLKHCNAYQLVWQSKVGPMPWLGPFTDDAIEDYVKQGRRNFVIVPIAFVNEHIETLHELDIEYCKDLASKLKVDFIKRVPAPNDHPIFIDAITDLVKTHIESDVFASPKFFTRCPGCTNKNCYESKQWFLKKCNPSAF